MKKIFMKTADVRRNFSEIVSQVFYEKKEIILTSHGVPKAKLVPLTKEQSELLKKEIKKK